MFGFDYFLDEDYNVFLIEVNTNPCLEESSALLQRLIPRMLDDMFKLTLDRVYAPSQDFFQASSLQNPILSAASTITRSRKDPTAKSRAGSNLQGSTLDGIGSHGRNSSIYPVPGYLDSCNMWERIGSLRQNVTNPIFVHNPHSKQASHSDKLIHLVNQYELRVAKPDIIDKNIRRDISVVGQGAQNTLLDT